MLERLESVFASAGIPHVNQSAYRRAVSCADAIFATQEVVARYLRGGSRVYMCLYDLQKAFDSVEYPVLLEKLYNAGVNSKMCSKAGIPEARAKSNWTACSLRVFTSREE